MYIPLTLHKDAMFKPISRYIIEKIKNAPSKICLTDTYMPKPQKSTYNVERTAVSRWKSKETSAIDSLKMFNKKISCNRRIS